VPFVTREFGIAIGLGARAGLEQIARVLAEPRAGIPELLRPTMVLFIASDLPRMRAVRTTPPPKLPFGLVERRNGREHPSNPRAWRTLWP
jgi:hypothetical protein